MRKATIALGAVSGLVLGCYRYAPEHCGNKLGDESCAAEMFCDGCSAENNGCVEVRPKDGCYLPAGIGNEVVEAESSGSSSTSPEGTTEEPSTTTGTTQTSGTTTPIPECMGDEECVDAALPLCGPQGECVTCEDMNDPNSACEGLDAQAPVCSDGSCVQCTVDWIGACEGLTPVCGGSNECVACSEHQQCPQSACHLDGDDQGACFDVAEVVTVANAGELTATLGGLGADGRAVVVLEAGTYPTTVELGMGVEVAVLGQGSATISGDGGLNAVELFGSSITYFHGVDVANSNNNGLSCSGTSLWLDNSAVRNNAQLGVDILGGCTAHMRRAAVRANTTGGVRVDGATSSLLAENSLIADNVGPAAGPGLRITAANVDITYSVIVSNGTFANPDNIECLSSVSGSIRNSIVAGPSGDSIVTCDALTWDFNALDSSGLGGTNQNVGPYDGVWFVDPGTGDYHLTTAGETALMGIAMWQDTDPVTDVDGDPVPARSPSLPGIDQP